MLIRVSGGQSGIVEYLTDGQKNGRFFSRDELDARVVLAGDLALTGQIIEAIDAESLRDEAQERYLHITLAFREDDVDPGTLKAIAEDFRQFMFEAYDDDEFHYYAEAHLPRIRSYNDARTGELIERKPHIHIVVPRLNLADGSNLNPFGMVKFTEKYIDAFQESINEKYGLASPKVHRRDRAEGRAGAIGRYDGIAFEGQGAETKGRAVATLLSGGELPGSLEEMAARLATLGEVRIRNEGTDRAYLNLRIEGQGRGVNLKDPVFTPAGLRAAAERPGFPTSEIADPRDHAQIAERLAEWRTRAALETRYLQRAGRWYKDVYKPASNERREELLAELQQERRAGQQASEQHQDALADSLGRSVPPGLAAEARRAIALQALVEAVPQYHFHTEHTHERPDFTRLTAEQRTAAWRFAALYQSGLDGPRREQAPEPLARVRHLPGISLVHDTGWPTLLLHADAPAVLGGVRSTGDAVRRAGNGAGSVDGKGAERPDGRVAPGDANPVGQALRDHATAPDDNSFAVIRKGLDGAALLGYLSRSHGVDPSKYVVTKAADGSSRIRAVDGKRNYTVSDFLTGAMHLTWPQAAVILRTTWALQGQEQGAQNAKRERPSNALVGEYKEERRARWDFARASMSEARHSRRAALQASYQQFSKDRSAIASDRTLDKATRKLRQSQSRFERALRDQAIRQDFAAKQAAATPSRESFIEGYKAFLGRLADRGREDAILELRKLAVPVPRDPQEKDMRGAPGNVPAPKPAQSNARAQADRLGNVTWNVRGRDVLVDRADRITVLGGVDTDAIELSLRMAKQKFSGPLVVGGTADFRRAVVQVAHSQGMRVEFADVDMRQYQAELKAAQRGTRRSR